MNDKLSEDADTGSTLAQQVGEVMFNQDFASKALEMRLEQIGARSATISMTIRRDMLNGLHTCHGGMLFTLADSAFAFACNSRNEATVAAGCSIEYLRPAHEGDRLTAVAQEQSLAGRSGVYDVTITNIEGDVIALFRGKSHRIKGDILGLIPN